jgi:hypothetical protein
MNYPAASSGVSTRKIFLTSPQAAGNTTLRDSKPFIKDHGKFYKRNSAGKYPMDVSELKIAFIQSEQIVDKIRKFRNDRVEKLKAEHELPVNLYSGAKTVLHLVPLSAFSDINYFSFDKHR